MIIQLAALYITVVVCVIGFYFYHTSLSEILMTMAKELDRLSDEVKHLKK